MFLTTLPKRGDILKFTCEKAVLAQAVSAASRTVTSRTSIPALEGVLCEVSNTTVTLTGFNLATGIRAIISIEDGEPGAVVINARLLGDIVRKSSDDFITVEADERLTVTIKNGMSEFKLMGLAATDFPALPEPENDLTIRMDQSLLKSMISMTIFAVSDNENKLIHTGELFDYKNGRLSVVAVDGYRLAVRREEVESSSDNFKFVVPGAALRECERLCEESDEQVIITLGGRHITFDLGDRVLISRLIEGEFLNYEAAIPKDSKFKVVAKADDLRDSVERVSLIISERLKNPIRCLFDDGRLKIWCQTALGRANDELLVEGDGGETEIGFNNRFLQDALRAVPDESVRVELSSGLSPCLFSPLEGDKYTFMVLPVRLK